jgi:hypothetical protein
LTPDLGHAESDATGRKKLQEVNPTPERTVDTLKNVPDALKGEAGGHR